MTDLFKPAPGCEFPTTHWSVVVAAGEQSSPESKAALVALCGVYWEPLYGFIRRKGYDSHTAQDLTQSFFARLLEKDYLEVVDREKGRFRSFLLTALRHFLANEWDRATAKKRGGRQVRIRLDLEMAEHRYAVEPAHQLTPERLFEKRWALTLLNQVFAKLRQEFVRVGLSKRFERLQPFLTEKKKSSGSYAEVAANLHITEAAVRQAVHRLRERFRELLHSEIAQVVASPEEVDDEIHNMLRALSY